VQRTLFGGGRKERGGKRKVFGGADGADTQKPNRKTKRKRSLGHARGKGRKTKLAEKFKTKVRGKRPSEGGGGTPISLEPRSSKGGDWGDGIPSSAKKVGSKRVGGGVGAGRPVVPKTGKKKKRGGMPRGTRFSDKQVKRRGVPLFLK